MRCSAGAHSPRQTLKRCRAAERSPRRLTSEPRHASELTAWAYGSRECHPQPVLRRDEPVNAGVLSVGLLRRRGRSSPADYARFGPARKRCSRSLAC